MKKVKELNIGYSDFKNVIENDNYFVDKSLFIEEVIKSQKAVLLLPRPRRFGKTMNLSMLKYFFDKNEQGNENLFKHLKISQSDENVKKHLGKYPVIYMSFKDAMANTWDETQAYLKNEIAGTYNSHYYLYESDALRPHEKTKFEKILNEEASVAEFASAVKQLCEYLYRYHNENIVILIDEYDAPIQSGYNKYYDEVVSFMRNLMSGAFKDNIFLFKGVITGILRVSKESIFSGLNNISVHSILEEEFSDRFGFTETEVKRILKDFNVKTDFSDIKYWYDGYKIGNSTNIYNPWSILNYVVGKNKEFNVFWANTSSNELIKHEIQNKDAEYFRQEILKLLSNKIIVEELEPNFVFPDLKRRKSLLWTLLTLTGYLTTKKKISLYNYELCIPNYEIKTIFQKAIVEWFEADLKVIKSRLEITTNYLINNLPDKFEHGFRQIMGDTFSYYDTEKNPEFAYQAYMLGLLAIIGDDYIIKSNRESGEGRYDIMLIPHDKSKYGIIMEIKQIDKQSSKETKQKFTQRINRTLEKAMSQIIKNKYYKELIENKIKENRIIKLPIVFAGKIPYVKK
ncbi:MAG: AAA family ATPase [Bacteroidia bacterium]|nr:AAA family ATPase [Bacteroidia bacterium]